MVTGALPEWEAVIVNVPPPRNVVVSVRGKTPASLGLRVGDAIEQGTNVRFAFNASQIAGIESAAALQPFCVQDFFRVKTSVVIVRGGAGTGKSYVRNQIVKKLRSRNLNTMCLAPTGLVAQSMPSGWWLGRTYSSQTVAWFVRHPPKQPVKHLHVIVDEYTMVSSRSLEKLWDIALDLCPDVRLTLIGDHAQLWPVEGLPPWSSKKLQAVQEDGRLAVYQLTHQQRYGSCERMKLLIDSLRTRAVTTANGELYRIAIKPPPVTGTCRLIAATNLLAAPANVRVHQALAAHEGSAVTTFEAFGSNPDTNLTLCNGERVRVCSNRTEARPGGGVTYTQVNGQEGTVIDLPGGTVAVAKDTRITIKLLDRAAELRVGPRRSRVQATDDIPMFEEDEQSGDEGEPKPKRRRKAAWTFQGALRPSSGQTAHTVQGSTFAKDERCVVDLAGFPQSILGYHMLIVALSRVQSVSCLYVLNYDDAMISKLASACPCGCVSQGPHPRSHSKARLESFHAHMTALATHVRVIY